MGEKHIPSLTLQFLFLLLHSSKSKLIVIKILCIFRQLSEVHRAGLSKLILVEESPGELTKKIHCASPTDTD